MKFSLIIPCYNEAASLPLLLERCQGIGLDSSHEVIFVDNGSTDNSRHVFNELLPQYVGYRSVHIDVNQGYGFGILSGLRAAKGDILGWTHADLQTDPLDGLTGLSLFNQFGSDIFVKGRRYGRPIGDSMFTAGMSVFETLLLQRCLWDINAQPTLFSRKFFSTWKNPPHDFSLDLYAYYQAKQAGMQVKRFPVNFGERAHGISHWNINWAEKRKFIHRTISYSVQLRKAVT